MKILFNCVNNTTGGSVQNAANYIKYASRDRIIEYRFLVSEEVLKVLNRWNIDTSSLYHIKKTKSYRLRAKEVKLSEKEFKPDIVYTMGGPSYFLFKSYHVMGISDPYLTHAKFINFYENRKLFDTLYCVLIVLFKGVLSRLTAEHYFFQTQQSRLGYCSNFFLSQKRTSLIPNALGESFSKKSKRKENDKVKKVIFIPAFYYPHKNIEIVFGLIDLFIKFGVSPDKVEFWIFAKFNKKIENELQKEKYANFVKNMDGYNYADASNFYQIADIILVPSLLETFSTSYLEAIAYEKPLVVPKLEFAFEICEHYPHYYDPRNVKDLCSLLLKLIADIEFKDTKYSSSKILKKYGTQEERYKKITDTLLSINKKNIENEI